MANIDDGFRVDVLSLGDSTLIATGTDIPADLAGFEAPQGSLYLRHDTGTGGELYFKFGPGDVDWSLVPSAEAVGLVQGEIDTLEVASGGIFAADGSYVGAVLDSGVIITGSTDLANAILQLDAAIGAFVTPNCFETIVVPSGGPIVADVASDTLTLTQSSGISITGTAGTDTINIAPSDDLAAVEALASTGIAVRTGTDAWTTRAVSGTTNEITVVDGDGVANNPTVGLADNPVMPGTEGTYVPAGTTAQRPTSPMGGLVRYNSTLDRLETYEATDGSWTGFVDTITTNDTREPTGFVNQTDSAISFTDATRTFTLSPVTPFYHVYYHGNRIHISSVKTVQIPDTNGDHFIKLDANGDLYVDTTLDITSDLFVALVVWNVSQQKAVIVADERHGIQMDGNTHFYLHVTRGYQWRNGSDIGDYNLTGDGTSESHVQFSLTDGQYYDEDIEVIIEHSATPTSHYEQILTPIAYIPVFYKSGATGAWEISTETSSVVRAGTNRAQYNLNTAGTWSLEEVSTDGYFVTVHIFASNTIKTPIIAIMGQAEHATLEAAIANDGLANMDFTGLPLLETKPIYTLVFETNSAFTNTSKSRMVDFADVRALEVSKIALSGGMIDHGGLDGLADDDHPQYVHISNDRTITSNITFNRSGAPFTIGASALNQHVAGLNADLLDGYNSTDFLPAGSDSYVQYNNGGAFGGEATFTYDDTLDRVAMTGATASQTRTIIQTGGTTPDATQLDTSALYIEVDGDATFEGMRTYFKRSTPGISGWISYHYDGSTPNIRVTDEDDDPPYIQFNVIGAGTYAAPTYVNQFGGRGPGAGATTGFSWKVNGTEISTLDSQWFLPPVGTTAQRPVTPSVGMTRFNTSFNRPETYVPSVWSRHTGIIDKTTTNAVITTAGPNNTYSFTVPGGTLGTDGILRLKLAGLWLNSSGGNRNVTIAVSYGGTTMWADTSPTLTTGNDVGWNMEFILAANNSTTSQSLNGKVHIGGTGAVTTGQTGDLATDEILSAAILTGNNAAVNSANDNALNVAVTFSGAGITWTKYFHTLELL